MASRASDSSSKSKKPEADQEKYGIAGLPAALSRLKKQIQASRADFIKGKLADNGKMLEACTLELSSLSNSRRDMCSTVHTENRDMLLFRSVNAYYEFNSSSSGFVEKECINNQEELQSSAIVFGSSNSGRCAVRPIKLHFVERIPPYTTWMFLDRNQRMADDQSVVGRRQIYYDQHGGETLICSDSEGELAEPEEDKHEFSEGEDQILWNALLEYGTTPEVLDVVSQFIDAPFSDIEERYEQLLKKREDTVKGSGDSLETVFDRKLFLNRTLSAALDSFDNLFCRRCMIFDCRLHGCSQTLVFPSEKQPFAIEAEGNVKPCGDHCYILKDVSSKMNHIEKIVATPSDMEDADINENGNVQVRTSEEKCAEHRKSGTLISDMASEINPEAGAISLCPLPTNGEKRKTPNYESSMLESEKASGEIFLGCTFKKHRIHASDSVSVSDETQTTETHDPIASTKGPDCQAGIFDRHLDVPREEELFCDESKKTASEINFRSNETESITKKSVTSSLIEAFAVRDLHASYEGQNSHDWNVLEKDLYFKGLEIFGKNSCLIARNLLSGLKTCKEVGNYMFNDGATTLNSPSLASRCSENNATDSEYLEQEMPGRTRIWRRRGRARKLKYTWKSAGHPSIRKRIADGKEQCKQYIPCGCLQTCGKQCSCLQNGTCCEKYCGCSKICKNRFRGCHCAKSQCRSRQCPCFAASRECDPDVCRNCWVSCGDGLLGAPPACGDGYHCGNMKLLLKQQQRILLGRSDVAGWGAFIKNPVSKNDYLGEYTGELVSHKEADKRGKIYDRANSSFLFDLNDQFVLDAYRKGDKLKFANHSSNPNCYAKVMLVAGDHRVGIFAKERIEASEELFYDYRYGPEQAPAWARKPEGSKRDDPSTSNSRRAHKVA